MDVPIDKPLTLQNILEYEQEEDDQENEVENAIELILGES